MRKIIIYVCWCVVLTAACKNRENVKAYDNDLGIKPAVIAMIDTANYSRISWEDTAKDFGVVKEGQNVYLRYRFTNSGNKPLYLSEVSSSCGCTVADYPQNAIMPGKGGEVTVSFNSKGHPGSAHKTVSVISNSSNRKRQFLFLNGKVLDSLEYSKYKK